MPATTGAQLDAGMLRMPTNQILVLLGYVSAALVLSLLYRRFVPVTDSPAWSGLGFGILVGACISFPFFLVFYGVYDLPYPMLASGLA